MLESDLDIIDLNDWILHYRPDVYEATKFLSDASVVMKIWTIAWREAGCPEIREPAT
jgi:hypothetical protein